MKPESIFHQTMKRCSKCILPETFPGIHYNENGICNYCLSWEPIKVYGKENLELVLSQYKNRGKEFDCIVPLSGGRDSAFVLYQMVKVYGMRVLALTVDSGFILPEGIRNIETCTKALNVPHVWLRDEKKIRVASKNATIKFQGWINKPSINTIIPVLNAADKTMNLQMYQYAHAHNIPMVIGGNNVGNSRFEQDHWKTGFMGIFPNDRGFYSTSDKIKLIFLFAGQCLTSPYNFRWPILKEYIEGSIVYFFESMLKPQGIHSLGFYDYIYWNEKEVVSTITKELNWQGAPDATTTWRIGDSAYPIINYIYLKLVGFTEHDEMYSKMIRENQIKRDEALKRCLVGHESQWIHGPRLVGLLKQMDVTKEQLDKILDGYGKKLLTKILKN